MGEQEQLLEKSVEEAVLFKDWNGILLWSEKSFVRFGEFE